MRRCLTVAAGFLFLVFSGTPAWSAKGWDKILDLGDKGLRVTFGTESRWPTEGRKLEESVDASKYDYLAVRAFNEEKVPLKVGVNLKDADGNCYQRVRLLPPQQWRNFRIPISQLKEGKDAANWWCDKAIDVSQIQEIVFQGHDPVEPFSVRFSSVYLVKMDKLPCPRLKASGCGDGILLEWSPLKETSLYEIYVKGEDGEAVRLCRFPHHRFVDISAEPEVTRSYYVVGLDLLGRPGKRSNIVSSVRDPGTRNALPSLDAYGGRKDIQLKSSGFFRTELTKGRWMLVDPKGHPFFSVGICVIGCGDSFTRVSGREELFKDILQERNDPRFKDAWSPWYGYAAYGLEDNGLVVSRYVRGRIVEDGEDWFEAWKNDSLKRLQDWHVNTLGAWSHGDLAARGERPFVSFSAGWGTCPTIPGANVPDVFHPAFVEQVMKNAEKTQERTDDPYLLGWFTANEMGWYGDWQNGKNLVTLVQMAPDDQPAKKAWNTFLQKRYKSIAFLNTSWETDFSDFEALSASEEKLPKLNGCKKDQSDFLRVFADRYFKATSGAIRKNDPHHLMLGARHSQSSNVEVIQQNAAHCEVLSATLYGWSPGPELTKAQAMTDKPWIVGEFHFMGEDAGLPLRKVQGVLPNQSQRGEAYQDYLCDALTLPNMVGAHWFEYIDEPATGRFNHGKEGGEAHNIGWVNVDDQPYDAFIQKARLINANIPLVFESKLKPRKSTW